MVTYRRKCESLYLCLRWLLLNLESLAYRTELEIRNISKEMRCNVFFLCSVTVCMYSHCMLSRIVQLYCFTEITGPSTISSYANKVAVVYVTETLNQ